MVRLVSAKNIGADTIIVLKERIASGELVVVAGDRTPARNSGGISEVSFLGELAYFPQGAFILASLMDAPLFFMFGLREDDRDFDSPYGFYVYRACTDVSGTRRERRVKIPALIEEFATRLESLCVAHPLQWYNFYDFWREKSAETRQSRQQGPSGKSRRTLSPCDKSEGSG
jgi:predicted LPLAT superfamily acyltransferase